MRAVQVARFGPPEVLRLVELPDPSPGPGQVVVAVRRCGVTFADVMTRAGRAPGGGGIQPPYVPGNAVGGTVAAVGPHVDPALVGRLVVSTTGGSGGYAEWAAVPATQPLPVPDGLALDPAMAMLTDGRTATGLFDRAGVRAGETVLVEAAGGGLGTVLVQLARGAGATVVAAARGAAKLDLARDLGAQVTVDYSEPGWVDRVRAATGGVDVLFESVGGEVGAAAAALIAPGGRLLIFGLASGAPLTPDPAELDRRGVELIGFAALRALGEPATARALATRALAEAAAGRLTPVIGQTFTLDRAADAHTAIETRATVGKTLLMT